MTESEKQFIIDAVLSSLRTNSRTIEQLTPVASMNDDDKIEIHGGRNVCWSVIVKALESHYSDIVSDFQIANENAIYNERQRAEAAENEIAASVEAERERAKIAESAIEASIAAEKARAEAAEAALSDAVTAVGIKVFARSFESVDDDYMIQYLEDSRNDGSVYYIDDEDAFYRQANGGIEIAQDYMAGIRPRQVFYRSTDDNLLYRHDGQGLVLVADEKMLAAIEKSIQAEREKRQEGDQALKKMLEDFKAKLEADIAAERERAEAAEAELQKSIDKNAALLAEANIRVFDRIIFNRNIILIPPLEAGEIVYSQADNAFYRYNKLAGLDPLALGGGSSSKGQFWPLTDYMDGDAPSAAILYRRRADSALYRYDASAASLVAYATATDTAALADRVAAAETDITSLKAPTERERQNAILGWDDDDRAHHAAHADDLAAFRSDIAYAVGRYDATRGKTVNRYEGDTTLVYAPQVRDLDSTAKTWMADNAFLHCSGLRAVGVIDFTGCTRTFQLFRGAGLSQCPDLYFPDATACMSIFRECKNLEVGPMINAPKNTSASMWFMTCSKMKSVRGDSWDLKTVTSASGMFQESGIIETPRLITPALKTASYMFCYANSLKKVTYIDFASATDIREIFRTAYALDILNIDHLGAVEAITEPATLDLHWSSHLGESDEGRAALVGTLLTNSHDRAAEGWEPLTVALHANALGRLTDDEIAAITAKGFTLTTV